MQLTTWKQNKQTQIFNRRAEVSMVSDRMDGLIDVHLVWQRSIKPLCVCVFLSSITFLNPKCLLLALRVKQKLVILQNLSSFFESYSPWPQAQLLEMRTQEQAVLAHTTFEKQLAKMGAAKHLALGSQPPSCCQQAVWMCQFTKLSGGCCQFSFLSLWSCWLCLALSSFRGGVSPLHKPSCYM